MSISHQTQRKQMMTAQSLGGGLFAGLLAALGTGLRSLGQQRTDTVIEATPTMPATMSELFARAMCENSNQAMDWLFYAAQLTDPAERRHCIRRALQIDSESEVVRDALRQMRWK